jgi:hypothetical protein
MYSLIVTAKMNNIDPQAWLADVLARIAFTSCCHGTGGRWHPLSLPDQHQIKLSSDLQ